MSVQQILGTLELWDIGGVGWGAKGSGEKGRGGRESDGYYSSVAG